MKDKKSTSQDKRTRNWSFVVYPDSAPKNWREIIDNEHIQWVESPLHDKDVDENGEIKKPHWHILVMYAGKKSFEQIETITKALNAPIPQIVGSTKGLVRYMIHMDDPHKYQYSRNDIVAHGGVDISSLLKATGESRYVLIGEMRKWVAENRCTEFYELFDYAEDCRKDDWFPLLCDNSSYIMGEYIKSRRHGAYKELKKNQTEECDREIPIPLNVDPETGEILDKFET